MGGIAKSYRARRSGPVGLRFANLSTLRWGSPLVGRNREAYCRHEADGAPLIRPRNARLVVIWRTLPLVGLLAFFTIAFGWRPWLQRRRYGNSGVLLFRSREHSQTVRDSLAIVWFALLVGQALAVALTPEWLPAGALHPGPERDLLRNAGAVLLFGGLIFMITAQLDLGSAWRIGIEEGARPGLVTGGLYGFCRNPIYLAFAVVMLGYTLLLPTLLSLIMLLATYFGFRQQVLREEDYLLRTYGKAYRDYANRIGRFLPGIGKLR
jgi:protein-S-isoprenylcysteine O-methyltransferase Ste14